MDFAFQKFQTRDQQKIWKTKLAEEQQIVNLTAQLKQSDAKFTTRFKQNAATATATKKKPSGKPKGGKEKGNFAAKRKERYDKAPAWMKKNPGAGPKSLKKDGDTYSWCAHHKLWQKHTTEECRIPKGPKPTAAVATPAERIPANTNDDKLVLDDKLAQLAYAADYEEDW
jgi:hypothetical protein